MLHVVLIPIAGNDRSVPPRERIRVQREAAARALDESARRAGLPRLTWQRDAAGVPIFERGVCWSLSHKPACSAGVVSTRPVGLDVEIVEPRKEGLWDYVASAQEQAGLARRDWPTFFRFWTAKEAVLKHYRAGLSRLDDCRMLQPPGQRSAQLAFDGDPCSVEFFEYGDILAAVTLPEPQVEWHRMA